MISMDHQKIGENRDAVRYNIYTEVLIENLVCDGRAYPLFTPLKVTLVDVSTSGARFSGPTNAFSDGDRFQMRLKIGGSYKILIADIVDHTDLEDNTSEYGCIFLIGSNKAVKP